MRRLEDETTESESHQLPDETTESESRQLPEGMKPWLTAMMHPTALPKQPPKMIHCRKGTWCMWAAVEDGDAERRYQWVPVSEAVARALGAETGQTRRLDLADAELMRQREAQTVAAVIMDGRATDATLNTLYQCWETMSQRAAQRYKDPLRGLGFGKEEGPRDPAFLPLPRDPEARRVEAAEGPGVLHEQEVGSRHRRRSSSGLDGRRTPRADHVSQGGRWSLCNYGGLRTQRRRGRRDGGDPHAVPAALLVRGGSGGMSRAAPE